LKSKTLRLGVLLLVVGSALPMTAAAVQAQTPGRTVTSCVNGRITVTVSGRAPMSFPCPAVQNQASGHGFIEICKDTQPATSGTFFSYAVPGAGTVSVPSGACSPPVSVASGTLTITEAAKDRYVLCGVSTEPSGMFVSSNLPAGTGTVTVPAGDVSTETIVFFKNCELGRLKLCKVAGNATPIGRSFAMTVTATSPAGPSVLYHVPAGPPPGGFCILSGNFQVGTQVKISDDLSRFFIVENTAHSVLPPGREVSFQPENNGTIFPATAHVMIGSGVTEVSFTNACTFPGAVGCGVGF
jgi:hypothetical protein